MADPIYFYPKLTAVGAEEALNAANNGLEIAIDSVSFGTGVYDPTGNETALVAPIVNVAIPGGSRITPIQIRLITVWDDPDAVSDITEVGYWSGSVLVFIWSRTAGGPIGKKTKGVDFVLFHDISFGQLPADSINVQVNPDLNQALAALMNHESANNAHPQYLLRRDFLNAHSLIAATSVGGSVNAITMTLPVETVITQYQAGQQFVFVANGTNTDSVTVNVNGLGSKPVIKNAVAPLSGGDIINGSVYTLFYDGSKFQLSAGVSGGGSMIRYEYIAEEGQFLYAANYMPGSIFVAVNGLLLLDDHYVANNGTSVVITEPTIVGGDEVIILAFKSFAVPDAYRKEEVDDLLANLTVTVDRVSDASAAGRLIMKAVATGTDKYIRINTNGTISLFDKDLTRADIGANSASNLTIGTLPVARMPALTGEVTLAAGTGTLNLATTGVISGTYGNDASVPQIVISNKGRVHTANNVAIRGASETQTGLAAAATLDDVNAGSENSKFVTAYKLRFGFSASFGSTGYFKLPSWMLGIEVRWGTMSVGANSNVGTGNIFTNNCFFATGSLRMATYADDFAPPHFIPGGRGLQCYNTGGSTFTVGYLGIGN